jgi:mannose/cellobiose epimerase-like protein (N-acyl-D-glucosamine 2-epimerase family)
MFVTRQLFELFWFLVDIYQRMEEADVFYRARRVYQPLKKKLLS